jgi:hypothetical protein
MVYHNYPFATDNLGLGIETYHMFALSCLPFWKETALPGKIVLLRRLQTGVGS